MSATSDANKALTMKFFDAVLNNQQLALVPQMISPAYAFNGQPQTAQQLQGWVGSLHTDFPGLHFTIEAILAEDDMVALRWRLDAPAAAGRPAGSARGTNILTFAGGQATSNVQNAGRTSPLTSY